jgi:hypothetical protein
MMGKRERVIGNEWVERPGMHKKALTIRNSPAPNAQVAMTDKPALRALSFKLEFFSITWVKDISVRASKSGYFSTKYNLLFLVPSMIIMGIYMVTQLSSEMVFLERLRSCYFY